VGRQDSGLSLAVVERELVGGNLDDSRPAAAMEATGARLF
jgi:hypothetical protein